MILLIISVIALLAQFLLLMTVFLKNRQALRNIAFMLLSGSLLVWAFLSFIFEAYSSMEVIGVVRLTMFCVVLQNTFFALFSLSFREEKFKLTKKRIAYGVFSAITALVALSPILFTELVQGPRGYYPMAGPGMLFFIVHAAISITVGFRNLSYALKHGTKVNKQQVQYVFFGSLVLWGLVPLTNFIYSITLKTTFFGQFSPIYGFVFSSLIAYAIIRHRLFDIRPIIARSLGYVLSIGFIVLAYAYTSSLLIDELTNKNSSNIILLAVNAVIFAIGVLLYPNVKKFFNRVTNSIFFRDAYDSELFLDQLNNTLVGNIEIGILLRHTTSVIEQNLKADCHIYVKQTETADARMFGSSVIDIKPVHLNLIREELSTIREKTVITDELGQHYLELKNALYINDIAVISSLITNYSASQEATAYLMLGPKKSGNSYNKQDMRIIDIITDELLIAIQNALRYEEIQSFNITLQNRINDATSKLKRSNEKLKEMDETKDEFISMASHQLRTPLTSVKGYLSMVLDGDAGKVPEQQQQLLKQAYLSSQRMVYLIADLLNVSRLKTGKFVIDATPTDLAEVVESEIDQLTEAAKSRKLTLNYSKPEDFPVLKLDETKTRQVIMNFIDNAIYYTPSGGKIKIELSTDRSSVYFMVKDNGLGVPKVDQSHLFSKFYRAKNAQKARPDGTGLGLFMAKKVITEQGGNILFESTEGKGSTFGFKFDKPKNFEDKDNKDDFKFKQEKDEDDKDEKSEKVLEKVGADSKKDE